MAYRASYGADTYGTALYGVTGAIDAAATVTPALSAACSAQIVREASSTIAASATVSSFTGQILIDGAATITLQSATVSVGEEYVEADGYRPGYGLRTYGTSIYGQNDSVEQGTATIAASLSVATAYVRERNVSVAIAASLSTTATGVFDVVGAANLAITSSITASANRVHLASSTSTIALSLAASGIEKWEPIAGTPETWTPVSATSETWTPITDSRAA